ncbi:MAG TPA: zinc-dependent metalloprotease [Microbacteriaceae bacterium]|nr:zinc-dependent metalloprotease [Microbacteriaceae bacterium]
MAEDAPNPESENEFLRMLGELLSGSGGIDPAQLAGAAGLPNDPASLAALMAQLQVALNQSDGGANWTVATTQGEQRAAAHERAITDAERAELSQAAQLAELWLDEATELATTGSAPKLMTRRQWVTATMPVWQSIAEPVSSSIADALVRVMNEQSSSEMQSALSGAGSFMRSIGGTLFAMQLGHVVGQLADEVVSGGDIGLPLLEGGQSALLPQNIARFGEQLEIPRDQISLYLSIRELAHARLFRHARWLQLEFLSSLTEFARGVHIDMSRLEELAESFDPSNPDDLRRALSDGSLIPPKTESQRAALARMETTLALIEGWVDSVTATATHRLPSGSAIAETIRRRRASGGPAESALSALVGLELRPRLLREAAAMWTTIGEHVGAANRDALWSHPDTMPTAADIADPSGLVARLTGTATPSQDDLDFDAALEALLRGETPPAPAED